MINFCQHPFISQASASLICQDGYEVDNLFSLDPKQRQRGYQIERFVRPPLSISIGFKLPVTVHYVVVWVGLHGAKEKCKVEFFALGNKANPLHSRSSEGCEKFCGSFILRPSAPSSVSFNGSSSLFHNPSSVVSLHLDHSSIPNEVLGSQVCERLVCQQITSQPLKPISQLTTMTNLTVCIKQYTSPKALHVKCLEVWGQPSRHSTVDDLRCFEHAKEACSKPLQQDRGNPSSSGGSAVLYNAPGSTSPKVPTTGVDNVESPLLKANECVTGLQQEEPIPDKFLDQLTFEVMALPYILPSGYHVDQLTVDKCRDTDLLYGRPPSDPFTGLPYTESCQPVFCAQLKSEIDFFTNHKVIRSEIRKTTGSAEEITKHRSFIAGKPAGTWTPIIIECV